MSNAFKQNFKTLHSIEFNEDNYKYSSQRFQENENVHIRHGSSPEVLPDIIDPAKATVFWLDAHYQGGRQEEQDKKYGQCPLLEELKAIFAVKWEIKPYVLIDDAKIFTKQEFTNNRGFDPDQWPTLNEITELIPTNYKITTDTNDILYCMP